MTSLTLHIDGMSCGHCLNAVKKALVGVPGLEVVAVTMGRAEVRFDPDQTDQARIVGAVTDAGYPAAVAAGA